MFLLSPLFLGPFGQFSIRSQVWETKWSRDASHHKSPSPMMIITPSHSHSQASDPLGQSEDKLEAGQWEGQVGLECSHCSQSPTLVVIIAGLTLTHSSLSDQLSPVLGVCCFKALCAHWSLVTGQHHEDNYISPTDTRAASPSPHLFAVSAAPGCGH